MLLCYIVEWDPTLRSYYGKVAPQGGMPLHYIEEWDSTLRSYLERAESSSVRWNATPYIKFQKSHISDQLIFVNKIYMQILIVP